MCACDSSFVCSRCKGAPFDPHYLLDEPDELSPAEFDWLTVGAGVVTELGRAESIANGDSGAWDTGPTGRHGYVMQAVAMAQVHATLAVAQAIREVGRES